MSYGSLSPRSLREETPTPSAWSDNFEFVIKPFLGIEINRTRTWLSVLSLSSFKL